MSKIDLDQITSGYNLSKINANFQKIEDALNQEVLYRKEYVGEPNEMQTNLDMNGKEILNVKVGSSPGSLATKGYVDQEISEERGYVDQQLAEVDLALSGKFDKTGGPISGPVQMGGNPISGLPNATQLSDPATYEQLLQVESDSDSLVREALKTFSGVLVEAPAWADIPDHSDPDLGDALDAQSKALAARSELLRTMAGVTVNTVAQLASLTVAEVGLRVHWLGYYAVSDGGSNWGVVKSGAHVHDGGSIFTITPTLYVEANLKGDQTNVKKFGAKGDGVTDDTVRLQTAIDYSAKVDLYFPAGTKYLVSSLVVGAAHGSSTILKMTGYGATIKAKTNNSTILRLGSATAILGGSKVEGLEFDLRNVSGCTAIKCYNYRNGSSLENLTLRGGVALTNNNIGVHFEELNWYTGMELVSCYGFAKGFWLGSSSNTVNLLSCAAEGCDIGVHIQRGTYVTVGVSITNGYYQGCRIGVWDERGWHTSINNVYFESNTEIDVWYDRAMFPHHISSAHLVDSATCIGIKGTGCEGATITGAGFHNSRLREYDWDASNTYCRATPVRTEFFGVRIGVTTGLKMYNNWNGTRQIGDIGVLPASGSGKLVGSMGTGTVDQRTVYIGNGFDAVRVDSSASPISVSDGTRVHYISINANVALTVSGTPISGQSLLLCIRSDNPNLVVTFAGKPIQWFTSGGTKNAVCEVVYIGEGLNQWMVGATWWT